MIYSRSKNGCDSIYRIPGIRKCLSHRSQRRMTAKMQLIYNTKEPTRYPSPMPAASPSRARMTASKIALCLLFTLKFPRYSISVIPRPFHNRGYKPQIASASRHRSALSCYHRIEGKVNREILRIFLRNCIKVESFHGTRFPQNNDAQCRPERNGKKGDAGAWAFLKPAPRPDQSSSLTASSFQIQTTFGCSFSEIEVVFRIVIIFMTPEEKL